MNTPRNESAPHVAVIKIEVHVSEQRPDGRVSGNTVHTESKLFSLTGPDFPITLRKLNELLAQVKQGTDQ